LQNPVFFHIFCVEPLFLARLAHKLVKNSVGASTRLTEKFVPQPESGKNHGVDLGAILAVEPAPTEFLKKQTG